MTYLKGILAGIAVAMAAIAFVVLLAAAYLFLRVELAARWGVGANGGALFGSFPMIPVLSLFLLLFALAFYRGFRMVVK